jgi:hypothetical protein
MPDRQRIVKLVIAGGSTALALGAVIVLSMTDASHPATVPIEFATIPLLEDGRMVEAYGQLNAAVAQSPQNAWLDTLRFNRQTTLRSSTTEKQALQYLAMVPRPPSPGSVPDDPVVPISPPGRPGIVYHDPSRTRSGASPANKFRDVFPLYARALGDTSIGPDSEALQKWQSVVVAPGTESAPKHDGTVVHLGGSVAFLSAHGFAVIERPSDGNCDLVATSEGSSAFRNTPPPSPFFGAIGHGVLPKNATVLAEVQCGDQRYPGLVRFADSAVYAFTFDFARHLIHRRQGDPGLANIETDGVPGLRPSDLFKRSRTAEQLLVPDADVWMLAILNLVNGKGPSLRLWPHPGNATTSVMVTLDQDFAPQERLAVQVLGLAALGVQPTLLSTAASGRTRDMPDQIVTEYRAMGVDIGAHPNVQDIARANDPLREQVATFLRMFPNVPLRSVRMHKTVWWDWIGPARTLGDAGYRWDLSYVTYLSETKESFGYMTGSGFPLPFFDDEGEALPIAQIATQMEDHANNSIPEIRFPFEAGSRHEFMKMTRDLIRASANTHHAPLTVSNHPLQFFFDPDWLVSIVNDARSQGAVVLNVAQYGSFHARLVGSGIRRTGPDDYSVHILNEQQAVLLGPGEINVEVDGHRGKLEPVRRHGASFGLLMLDRGLHTLRIQRGG